MKLKQAGPIKEVFYHDWLANTVVVKKKNGKWRRRRMRSGEYVWTSQT